MVVRCSGCAMFYDDEFRWTLCPHETFAANDGHNRFAHHPLSYLSAAAPLTRDEAVRLADALLAWVRAQRAAGAQRRRPR